ncbi:B3 domain-containing protein Os06g0107800 [Oryza glaberrima]|uniref:TF-B3 domain-containing protein n=2 Tax=Oryza TaxID=4527 RepID=A0A0D3FL06_9ORYZ|nr:B3 domain-containing protein Os06g0107800 [Oryza glaberrima]
MATIVAWESRSLQLQGGGGGHGGGGGERREYMFEKVVTPSDVGKLNRLVVPKHYAEKYFPLGPAARTSPAGTVLCFEDARGGGGGGDSTWRFRYSYWSSSQSYVITKGWSRYVRDKRLAAGDTVSFCRAGARLFIDCRKRAASVSSSSLVPPALIKVQLPPSRPVVDEEEAACGRRCLRLFGVDLQLRADASPALDLQL